MYIQAYPSSFMAHTPHFHTYTQGGKRGGREGERRGEGDSGSDIFPWGAAAV